MKVVTISSWLNFGRPARPGRGSAAGRKFLAPPYYRQRAVFASLWALFFISISSDVTTRRKSISVERSTKQWYSFSVTQMICEISELIIMIFDIITTRPARVVLLRRMRRMFLYLTNDNTSIIIVIDSTAAWTEGGGGEGMCPSVPRWRHWLTPWPLEWPRLLLTPTGYYTHLFCHLAAHCNITV